MWYVLPVHARLRGRLDPFPRLYACPVEPEPPAAEDPLVILDSGAYGLSCRGRTLGPRDFPDLEWYYLKYGGSDRRPIVAVAPDIYLDPDGTVRNHRAWVRQGRRPVAPVVQFRRAREVDMAAVADQANYYRTGRPPFLFVSNPGLKGVNAIRAGFGLAVALLRERINSLEWIHVLGAGWDLEDIRAWSLIPGIDSIDSIAYYQEAQRGNVWWKPAASWPETAVANGLAGSFVALGRPPAEFHPQTYSTFRWGD